MEAGTLRNICSLEMLPARSRYSQIIRGKPTHVSVGKADDAVERNKRERTVYRRGRGSSIQGQTLGANVGKLPWAAGTGYNLQGLSERG